MEANKHKIKPYRISKLTDVIDEPILRMILKGFIQEHGVPLNILDKRGDSYYRINSVQAKQNYCNLCAYFRSFPEGEKLCQKCDADKANELLELREPQWYFCHLGLVDFVFPIEIEGQVVAAFFSGQRRLKRHDDKVKARARELVSQVKGLSFRKMKHFLREMHPVTEEDIKRLIGDFSRLMNHISKLASERYSAQKKLQEELFFLELLSYFVKSYSMDLSPLWNAMEIASERIKEFCGMSYVLFFVSKQGLHSELSCKASNGELPRGFTSRLLLDFRSLDSFDDDKPIVLDSTADRESIFPTSRDMGVEKYLKDQICLIPIHLRSNLNACLVLGMTNYDQGNILNPNRRSFLKKIAQLIGGQMQSAYSEVLEQELKIETDANIEKLEKANRAREEFIAEMTHQLKGPAQSIRAESEYLTMHCKKKYQHDKVIMDSANKTIEEVDILNHQMENASFITTMDKQDVYYRLTQFLITPIIKECIKRFTSVAKRRLIDIVAEFEDSSLELFGDKEKMSIAFNNLLDNAVKYSHRGKKIKIKAYQRGQSIIVEIGGFGLGIPDDDIDKIFEKYYRGRLKDRRRFIPGTGIGLTVAKEIIEAHDGAIAVESRPAGGEWHDPDKLKAGESFLTTFTVALTIK